MIEHPDFARLIAQEHLADVERNAPLAAAARDARRARWAALRHRFGELLFPRRHRRTTRRPATTAANVPLT